MNRRTKHRNRNTWSSISSPTLFKRGILYFGGPIIPNWCDASRSLYSSWTAQKSFRVPKSFWDYFKRSQTKEEDTSTISSGEGLVAVIIIQTWLAGSAEIASNAHIRKGRQSICLIKIALKDKKRYQQTKVLCQEILQLLCCRRRRTLRQRLSATRPENFRDLCLIRQALRYKVTRTIRYSCPAQSWC
jgi:hypothetical protein